MEPDIVTALIGFAFVASATPGPNNTMLLASGANFGVWRTVPHMLGISLGMAVMVVLVGLGLMQMFDAYPIIEQTLKVISVIYLLWLAWKIATVAPARDSAQANVGRPLSFLQAAAFQWVNPKAWAAGIYAITQYATEPDGSRSVFAVAVVGLAFALIAMPSVAAWTVMGQQMQRFLTSVWRLRLFNGIMAALLIATLYPILWPDGWS